MIMLIFTLFIIIISYELLIEFFFISSLNGGGYNLMLSVPKRILGITTLIIETRLQKLFVLSCGNFPDVNLLQKTLKSKKGRLKAVKIWKKKLINGEVPSSGGKYFK